MGEKRIPVALEFDFTNKICTFGGAKFLEAEDGQKVLEGIYINMAAILWACSDDPELDWKEFTADTVIHELLHVVQHALGRLFTEGEVERAIDAARGRSREDIPDTDQEIDCDELMQNCLEQAEARIRELEEENARLKGANQ